MPINNSKAFTLIEVIIYIALFSLLIGTALVTTYQLIDGSWNLSRKNIVQEEGNFVMRKINWALAGVQTINNPTSGSDDTLSVTKYNGDDIIISLDGTKINLEMNPGGLNEAITTESVAVSTLEFTYISGDPSGIRATATITENGVGFPFTITKYIRK